MRGELAVHHKLPELTQPYNLVNMASAPKSITSYRLTDHAKIEMERRGITEDQVASVLRTPEQSEPVREGREAYHARFELGEPPKTYLI